MCTKLRLLSETGYARALRLEGDFGTRIVKKAQPDHTKELLREWRILAEVTEHPNIIGLISFSPKRAELFLEDGGETLYSMYNKRHPAGPEVIWQVAREVAAACAFIHEKGFFHGDLKEPNIVFNGRVFKVIDFGLADTIDRKARKNNMVSSFPWRAPEAVIPPETPKEGKYGEKTDIWSLGCILYTLAAGGEKRVIPSGRWSFLGRFEFFEDGIVELTHYHAAVLMRTVEQFEIDMRAVREGREAFAKRFAPIVKACLVFEAERVSAAGLVTLLAEQGRAS